MTIDSAEIPRLHRSGAPGAHLAPSAADLMHLRAVARGEAPADLLVRGARVLALHSREVLERDVLIANGFIAALTPVERFDAARTMVDAQGRFLAPTFIDTHIHIEYSMLTPGEFARCVIPKGTGCVLADPNCIGNVLGAAAMDWAGCTDTPLKILQQISHRIPRAPQLELGGATVTEGEQLERLVRAGAVTVGESLPFTFDERAARMQALALATGRRCTGHSARVADAALWGLAATGIGDDHNAFETDEVRDRLRLGMMVTVMSGSMNDNVPLVFADVDAVAGGFEQFSFCADDRHVDDLHRIGHIDHHVRAAIAAGVPALEAYRMASLNAAAYYGIDHLLGSITPTRRADFMLLDELETAEPVLVYLDGRLVAAQGADGTVQPCFENTDPIPETLHGTMRLSGRLSPETFRVAADAGAGEVAVVRAMEMHDGYFKRAFDAELAVVDGGVQPDPGRDVAKIAIVDRHHGTDAHACGFVRGFGLQRGAIAATTNCENQNLVVLGTNDDDMASAAHALAELGGGYVAVADRRILASLPLPLAGIMSDRPWEEVLEASDAVNAAAHALGSTLPAPFMILAFVGLAGVPDYGLTERGLIDAASQSFVPVVRCCRCPTHAHRLSDVAPPATAEAGRWR